MENILNRFTQISIRNLACQKNDPYSRKGGQEFPRRPKNNPITILVYLVGNSFGQHFIIFGRKIMGTTAHNYNPNLFSTGQASPERPQNNLKTIKVPYNKKYFSPKNPSFSREEIFIISNLCAARSRHFFNFQWDLLCVSKSFLHDLARENNYHQNKLATVEK